MNGIPLMIIGGGCMCMALFMTIFEIAGVKDEYSNMGLSLACSLLVIIVTAAALA